jgi:hypothetical protein
MLVSNSEGFILAGGLLMCGIVQSIETGAESSDDEVDSEESEEE